MNQNNIDMGSVHIHKKVIAEIVESAINDMEGVSLSRNKITKQLFSFLHKDDCQGIVISVDEEQKVKLDLALIVQFGLNIPDIAQQVQDNVKKALDDTVNIKIRDININIQGIERGRR